MDLVFKNFNLKKVSVSKLLSNKYGEKWKYIPMQGRWVQKDGTLYVQKTLSGVDVNGEYTGEWTLYCYDNSGQGPTEWVSFFCKR